MEQVFEYVNEIMARQQVISRMDHNATRLSYRTDLKLVTYNIVPLSPQAGVSSPSHSVLLFVFL
jgi:phosphatidylinositol kinase/protein kinase (PI-3  family)